MHITIKTNISRDVLESVIVTALEGGSNSWYYLSDEALAITKKAIPDYMNTPLSINIAKAVLDHGVTIPIHDCESMEEQIGELSLSTMGARLQALSNDSGYAYALNDEIAGAGDATSSDVVFQYMVLGEVVYG